MQRKPTISQMRARSATAVKAVHRIPIVHDIDTEYSNSDLSSIDNSQYASFHKNFSRQFIAKSTKIRPAPQNVRFKVFLFSIVDLFLKETSNIKTIQHDVHYNQVCLTLFHLPVEN